MGERLGGSPIFLWNQLAFITSLNASVLNPDFRPSVQKKRPALSSGPSSYLATFCDVLMREKCGGGHGVKQIGCSAAQDQLAHPAVTIAAHD